MDVCYIVLHYQNVEETIECVDSVIKNHGRCTPSICIVDNGSPNQSIQIIKNKYDQIEGIYFIFSEKNLGFANGMNLGIDYMSSLGFNGFYVLLNNDTVLDSNNWDSIINKKYNEHKFGVLGPNCYSPNYDVFFNPFIEQKTDAKSLLQLIKYKKREFILNFLCIRQLQNLFKKNRTKQIYKMFNDADLVDVPLQGSCLIISPDYIKKYKHLYENTFLYFEEAILRHRCRNINLPFVFSPSLKLIHKCSITLKKSIKSDRKKELFYLKESMRSVKRFYSDVVKGIE